MVISQGCAIKKDGLQSLFPYIPPLNIKIKDKTFKYFAVKYGMLLRYFTKLTEEVSMVVTRRRHDPAFVPIDLELDLRDGFVHFIEIVHAFLLSLLARCISFTEIIGHVR